MRATFAVCIAAFFSHSASSQIESGTKPEINPTLAELVVTGEQPGPQLWKLTKGGHLLWILATATPKPRDITWRSQEVADVLDFTQEVIDQQLQGTSWLANISIDFDGNDLLGALKAGRRLKKISKEHPKHALREVLSADHYERVGKLKAQYLSKNADIEFDRPSVAASRIYTAALDAKGLSMRAMIYEEVHRLVRKRHIRISEVTLKLKYDVDTWVAINSERYVAPSPDELPCFVTTLERIESQLPTITARANAWAVGNVKLLRELPMMRDESCERLNWSAPRWSKLESQLKDLWLTTIESAVARNKSTLVMLDMAELLQPQGILSTLASRGYDVEGP